MNVEKPYLLSAESVLAELKSSATLGLSQVTLELFLFLGFIYFFRRPRVMWPTVARSMFSTFRSRRIHINEFVNPLTK
jgi:hypothetical protein